MPWGLSEVQSCLPILPARETGVLIGTSRGRPSRLAKEIDERNHCIPVLVYRGVAFPGNVLHELEEVCARKLLKFPQPLFIGLARRRNLLPRLLRGRVKFQLDGGAIALCVRRRGHGWRLVGYLRR